MYVCLYVSVCVYICVCVYVWFVEDEDFGEYI